nr:hypothetical protein [Microctonus hyperodae filamentous virus]
MSFSKQPVRPLTVMKKRLGSGTNVTTIQFQEKLKKYLDYVKKHSSSKDQDGKEEEEEDDDENEKENDEDAEEEKGENEEEKKLLDEIKLLLLYINGKDCSSVSEKKNELLPLLLAPDFIHRFLPAFHYLLPPSSSLTLQKKKMLLLIYYF